MADKDDNNAIDIDEKDLLSFVMAEMRSSVGFEYDADLIAQRERATMYVKGIMNDVPALQNRSRAVSTDVADMAETALADIVPIFTDGEDVITFRPVSEEDEEQAQQETDYVNHVFFAENDGYSIIYNYVKDALLLKMGMLTWWWQDPETVEPETYDGKTSVEVMQLIDGLPEDAYEVDPCDDQGETGEQLYDVTITRPQKPGQCKITSFDPNDFTIARDATTIEDCTYCARRSRPRAQELIAMGIERDLVEKLSTWTLANSNSAQLAKDTVSESTLQIQGSEGDLRQVLVIEHYLRMTKDGKTQTYQVLTDWSCAIVLRAQKVNRINIAAGGPYPNTHRFYCTSLADKTIETQRVKTALTRIELDHAYFTLNQRVGVDMNRINDHTLTDIVNNVPGGLLRTDGPPAEVVQMISPTGLSFDPLALIEAASVAGEQRTGIVRNAQGLNPDTLHDTAAGAMALMTNAQKRLRIMARNLAEGLRDALLGIHATLCENATEEQRVKIRGQWKPVNPSQWQRRNDMSIEIGHGAGNQQHDLLVAQTLGGVIEQLVAAQGGIHGPLATPKTILSAATDVIKALGKKQTDKYLPDPNQPEPPPAPPPPDPALIKVQQDGQIAQAQLQLEHQKAEQKQGLDEAKAAGEHMTKQQEAELRAQQIAVDDQYRRDQANAELAERQRQFDEEMALKTWQAQQELELERERMQYDIAKHEATLSNKADIASNVKVGGEPG